MSKSLSDKICFLFIFFIFSDVKYMHTGLVSVSIPLSLIFTPAVKSSRIYELFLDLCFVLMTTRCIHKSCFCSSFLAPWRKHWKTLINTWTRCSVHKEGKFFSFFCECKSANKVEGRFKCRFQGIVNKERCS